MLELQGAMYVLGFTLVRNGNWLVICVFGVQSGECGFVRDVLLFINRFGEVNLAYHCVSEE